MNSITLAPFKTYPSVSLVFQFIDRILEFSVMRFLRIISHHWHWEDISYEDKFDPFGIELSGAPSGNLHTHPLSGVIAHLGFRPYGYIIAPEEEGKYFLAFRHKYSNHFKRCKIELNEPVMLLTAPDEGCIVYAMDEQNKPIRLKLLSGLIHRKEMPNKLRIL